MIQPANFHKQASTGVGTKTFTPSLIIKDRGTNIGYPTPSGVMQTLEHTATGEQDKNVSPRVAASPHLLKSKKSVEPDDSMSSVQIKTEQLKPML